MTDLVVISGGLREPSSTRLLADRIAEAVRSELAARNTSSTFSVIELRPLARGIVDTMLAGFAPPELESAFDTVARAEGLVAVTPAFNASFSGLFKSFFDVLPEPTLSDMPVLMAATGGTERHSLVLEHAMRPMFSYLHAVVAPTGVYASTADFGTQHGLTDRINRAAGDFARLLGACGPRERRDPFTDELSEMERLLEGPRPIDDGETVQD